ncbi:hypothetical protein TREES_T100001556 [Tupaia chinensis]|uniref:Uncharacterized protein n=1 Tax=Tupaia chinensis TaxID=246437 RepID=L9KNG6_TUPCH|nr:hypothetical protein TREES_T100001556 [Tupaia chinensis]
MAMGAQGCIGGQRAAGMGTGELGTAYGQLSQVLGPLKPSPEKQSPARSSYSIRCHMELHSKLKTGKG